VNAAAIMALVSAGLAVGVGVLARRLAHAPGSGEQRWFSVVAFGSASYALCNLSTTLPASPLAVIWLSRLQVASLVVHLWGWVRYSQAFLALTPSRWERLGERVLLAAAAFTFVPGAVFGDVVVDRPFAPLGVVYRVALPSATGDLLFALLFVAGIGVAFRFGRAWRAGVSHAGLLAAALGALLAFSACDALGTALLLPLPFLLDSGFAVPVLAVGWLMATRFVESARALETLRAEAVNDVETRTRELSSALESLHQAEKLASLGQFANGVAHEVNNPAAVVSASLRFLAEEARTPAVRLSAEAEEALADASAAMERIADLVRKLVDAGRIAVAPSGSAVAEVCTSLEKVVGLQPPSVRGTVRLDGAAASGALVPLRADALEQVIETLLRNASDAIPAGRDGHIEIRAERRNGAVRIVVSDDGDGMPPEILRRVFDPFFTTKPQGRGTGLGLPVARGLVEGAGGAVWLESQPGAGTRAVVELPEARAPDRPREA
jgi:signal transduction histidine kinase